MEPLPPCARVGGETTKKKQKRKHERKGSQPNGMGGPICSIGNQERAIYKTVGEIHPEKLELANKRSNI